MATKTKQPTELQKALRAVRNGADIFDYTLASTLRTIEREHPELITITKPMAREYHGAERLPYFGCIATAAGRKALRKRPAASRP